MSFSIAAFRARPWLSAWAMAAALLAAGGDLRGQFVPDPRTPAETAMVRGAEFLLKAQKQNHWERSPRWGGHEGRGGQNAGPNHAGGETALALLALFDVGDRLDDPRLRPSAEALAPAVRWLAKVDPQTSYVAALQALALTRVPGEPGKDIQQALERDRAMLLHALGIPEFRPPPMDDKARVPVQPPDTQPAPVPHLKITHDAEAPLALQALVALHGADIDLPPATWAMTERYWRTRQGPDGSWSSEQITPTAQTAAAIASLLTLRAFQEAPATLVPRPDPILERGLAWLDADFSPAMADPFGLYQIERVGLASGRRVLGRTDWYAATTARLLKAQQDDGGWDAAQGTFGGDGRIVATAWMLRFLAGGRPPMVFAKFHYGPPPAADSTMPGRAEGRTEGRTEGGAEVGADARGVSRWDARPRDVAGVVEWLGQAMSRPLGWQIADGGTDVGRWLDAPVLVITGSKDPALTAEDIARLKAYVRGGGTILSSADGDDKEFTAAITGRYMPQVLGEGYPPRELPDNHAVFELWGKISNPPRLLACGNGVRELWIHSPRDLGAAWQSRKSSPRESLVLAANVYAYATGKLTPPRPHDPLAPVAAANPVHRVRVARVLYAGNADPEPGAWEHFAAAARGQFKTDVQVVTAGTAKDLRELDPKTTPVAHLTGTGKFALADEQVAALKTYLAGGGLLLADAAGGNAEFSASFKALARQLLPEARLETIPRNDLLYNGAMADALRITQIEYRRLTTMQRRLEVSPRLQGARRNGGYAIIFSEDDLTGGLLGLNTWGISGYTPRSAQALVRNILLYSLHPPVAPTTGAADASK